MKRVVKIEDRGKDCVLLEVLMILVSILLMLNRFYVRTSVGQKPGLDDYTILASMVPSGTRIWLICLILMKLGFLPGDAWC